MADSRLVVTISGVALSLLLYENARSVGDQMGFLLGEILVFVTKKFTDSDKQVEHVRIHIDIDSVVACPIVDLIQDSTGKVKEDTLKDITRDKSKRVVGWFRFRQNASLVPTLRDRILHKQFALHFSNGNNSNEELFVACFLNSSVSNKKGTHKYRHVFLRHKKGVFEPIPLKINNLGADASRHDGSDYKPIPRRESTQEPNAFDKIIESLKPDISNMSGVESVTAIERAAERHLASLIPLVNETDREVYELEKQVQEMRAKILARKQVSANERLQGNKPEREISSQMEHDKTAAFKNQNVWKTDILNTVCKDITKPENEFLLKNEIMVTNKTRNIMTASVKNINQERARTLNLRKDAPSSTSQDPFANMMSELKMDIEESPVSTRTYSQVTKKEPDTSPNPSASSIV
ncbi:BRISC complex subunit FAM175B-like [Orussus abietinus]|uniref:BRISC complex subunit FAM175B-like n=1 Tax=Orussus abietinus TaxID=222816 RepID=UPI0006255A6A|nr:BRISC complex subunit FAM175B-like [Orussus abietinus]